MVRVSEEVSEQRGTRIREAAHAHGREPSEEVLYLAGWTIVVTNVPRARLSLPEALVRLAAPLADRAALPLVERAWADRRMAKSRTPGVSCVNSTASWRPCSSNSGSSRRAEGRDPWRSLVKAAAVVQSFANRIMVALYEGGLEHTLRSIVRCMRSGCRIERRLRHPSTVQLLLEGLDWQLTLT